MSDNNIFRSLLLSGIFTARAPISHIGESISTTSYLVQDPIVQPDGTVADVFSYSGNAWRGQLRDLMARRIAEAVGGRLPPDAFHLLFSGGRLDMQDRKVDLDGARHLRTVVPMLALLGGGIGSEILSGRLRVFNSYPVCAEAIPVLPGHLHRDAAAIPYSALTFEKEFSRKDDAKSVELREFLDTEPVAPKTGKIVADQMRMTSELVAPGTRLYTEIHGAHVSRIELGCLVKALTDFARSPCIGGQNNKGHGLVDLVYQIEVAGQVGEQLISVTRDGMQLSDFAAEVMSEYDGHLAASVTEVRAVLKCAA